MLGQSQTIQDDVSRHTSVCTGTNRTRQHCQRFIPFVVALSMTPDTVTRSERLLGRLRTVARPREGVMLIYSIG
jgi:hypothetical protein